jgi:antibiotic biosynthesis monooxygenase (ABM) superfamily enzyme
MSDIEHINPKTISVIIDREVLPGKKAEFEDALRGIIEACKHYAGYLGTDVHMPETDNDNHYRIVVRFASLAELQSWEDSPERLKWVAIIDKLIKSPTKLNVISGLETWFALPRAKTITPPKRYKMAIITWLAITPLLIGFNLLVQPLIGHLSMVPRILLSTPFIVLLMTYLVMPYMAKIFSKWLYKNN